MYSGSLIDRNTIQAFIETEYHVFGCSPFTLRIGEASSALAAECREHHAESSAFVTACNPNSQRLDNIANAERHASLRRQLTERNLVFIEGEGKHPKSGWPAEPSFLVFGIELQSARDLCNQLQQDAFVWAPGSCVPELILLR